MGSETMRQSSTALFTLMLEIRKLKHLHKQLGEEANRALEVLHKEVACHRLDNKDAANKELENQNNLPITKYNSHQ